MTVRHRAALLGALLLAAPVCVRAQSATSPNIDSLTAALASRDPDSVAVTVAVLASVKPSLLPRTTRIALIALLERAAVRRHAPRAPDGEDTGDGETLIQLVRLVARLEDPASTRALALGGLDVNLASQRFVASQGDAALPYLVEAEAMDTMLRSSVTITRAHMLGEFSDRLSTSGRIANMAAVLRAAPRDPTTFAEAAQVAGIVTAVPLVQRSVANARSRLTRALLRDALDSLVAMRARTSVPVILASMGSTLDGICSAAQGARLDACQSMRDQLRDATTQIAARRLLPARDALDALSARAAGAIQQHAIESWEGVPVSGTATYVKTRL